MEKKFKHFNLKRLDEIDNLLINFKNLDNFIQEKIEDLNEEIILLNGKRKKDVSNNTIKLSKIQTDIQNQTEK